MPRNYKTETGFQPWYKNKYGALEHTAPDYPPRTEDNVLMADATILISLVGLESTGTILTEKLCTKHNKPYWPIKVSPMNPINDAHLLKEARWFLEEFKPAVLNFAGNRESKARGIEEWTFGFVRNIWLDWA